MSFKVKVKTEELLKNLKVFKKSIGRKKINRFKLLFIFQEDNLEISMLDTSFSIDYSSFTGDFTQQEIKICFSIYDFLLKCDDIPIFEFEINALDKKLVLSFDSSVYSFPEV